MFRPQRVWLRKKTTKTFGATCPSKIFKRCSFSVGTSSALGSEASFLRQTFRGKSQEVTNFELQGPRPSLYLKISTSPSCVCIVKSSHQYPYICFIISSYICRVLKRLLNPEKWTAGSQSHGGLVQMISGTKVPFLWCFFRGKSFFVRWKVDTDPVDIL